MGSSAATYVFSAAALGELIADKLPFIPNRTSPGPLFGRIVLGALSGAALCTAASASVVIGAILGGAGGLVGAFAGYQARAGLVKKSGWPALVIALLEDLDRGWRRPFPGFAILSECAPTPSSAQILQRTKASPPPRLG
jgi:uncharacterized membrane protein